MAARVSEVSVSDLRSRTSRILRRVEAGERITVTKRGKAVATLTPSNHSEPWPSDSVYRNLQRDIDARNPRFAKMTDAEVRREMERISRKVARNNPYKTWQQMDRAMKGDRFGLSRR